MVLVRSPSNREIGFGNAKRSILVGRSTEICVNQPFLTYDFEKRIEPIYRKWKADHYELVIQVNRVKPVVCPPMLTNY
jgi:hypothetical protein